MIPLLLSADQVVSALVNDQPLAVDENDYNLEIKVGNTHVYTCISHSPGRQVEIVFLSLYMVFGLAS